jgi:hypothetical protein
MSESKGRGQWRDQPARTVRHRQPRPGAPRRARSAVNGPTRLVLEPGRTVLRRGAVSHDLRFGADDIARSFRSEPPSPLELERAIDLLEDELARVPRSLRGPGTLASLDARLHGWAGGAAAVARGDRGTLSAPVVRRARRSFSVTRAAARPLCRCGAAGRARNLASPGLRRVAHHPRLKGQAGAASPRPIVSTTSGGKARQAGRAADVHHARRECE